MMSLFLFSSKKGQGLSINFIVMVAIALIVMAVIIMIFLNKSKEGSSAFSSCELSGGICVSGTSCIGKSNYGALPQAVSGTCVAKDGEVNPKVCCLRDSTWKPKTPEKKS